jgi:hypothetical protein
MEDDNYKKIYYFDKPKSGNKVKILIFSMLVLSSIVVFEGYIYQKNKSALDSYINNQKNTLLSKTSTPTDISYKQAAISASVCILAKGTDANIPEQLYALHQLYLNTENEKYLDQLKTKITSLQSNDSTNQPVCKLLLEVAQNKSLTVDQQTIVKEYCLKSTGFIDNDLLQELKTSTENIKDIFQKNINPTIIEESNNKNNIQKLSLFANELFSKYYFSHDSTDLQDGIVFLSQAYKSYLEKENWVYPESCSLGTAFLDFYNFDKNETNGKIAQKIFNDTKTINNIKNVNVYSQAYCSEFFLKYSNLFKDQTALQLNQMLIDKAISTNFNSKELSPSLNNSQCFYDTNDKTNHLSYENSLIINSLVSGK